ncbi:MAG: hypothetical protein AAB567_01195 [Patescibacteria group bacterium]
MLSAIPIFIVLGVLLFFSFASVLGNLNLSSLSHLNVGRLGLASIEQPDEIQQARDSKKETRQEKEEEVENSSSPQRKAKENSSSNQSSRNKTSPISHQTIPPPVLDTIITKGPSNHTIFFDTTTVSFEFVGTITPSHTLGEISFETKIDGLQEKWQSTSTPTRTIILPPGPKEYTFLVRAKWKEIVDLTPASRTFRINVSPYSGKVKISRINPPRNSQSSQINLTTKLLKNEAVNITGWRFEGRTDQYSIPKGVRQFAKFDTSQILREDIILEHGDTVVLTSSFNPFANNFNFKPNQCFGYLAKGKRVSSSIPTSCPFAKPSKEELSLFSPSCQDFISKNIRGCEIPDYSQNLPILRDFDCVTYLKNIENQLTYEACFQRYSRDENFFKNEWHIFTDGEEFLRLGHDYIVLRDQNGLFVDTYIY